MQTAGGRNSGRIGILGRRLGGCVPDSLAEKTTRTWDPHGYPCNVEILDSLSHLYSFGGAAPNEQEQNKSDPS